MFKEKYGVGVEAEDFLPFTGTGEARFIGGVAEKYGVELDMDTDKKLTYEKYVDLIQGKLHTYMGVEGFIEKVKQKGLKLAVASSADVVKVQANLMQLGFAWADFEVVVTGSDVVRHKPDPQCFELVASKLGLEGCECLVVEDAVAGVKAGKAAGSRVLGLTTSFSEGALYEAGADWVAADLGCAPEECLDWSLEKNGDGMSGEGI